MSRCFDPVERAKQRPRSLRAAVDAMCWDCQGRGADPAPHWRIGNCEVPGCPLHPHRPYQNRGGDPAPEVLKIGSSPGLGDSGEQSGRPGSVESYQEAAHEIPEGQANMPGNDSGTAGKGRQELRERVPQRSGEDSRSDPPPTNPAPEQQQLFQTDPAADHESATSG